jgi:hypothetical protein
MTNEVPWGRRSFRLRFGLVAGRPLELRARTLTCAHFGALDTSRRALAFPHKPPRLPTSPSSSGSLVTGVRWDPRPKLERQARERAAPGDRTRPLCAFAGQCPDGRAEPERPAKAHSGSHSHRPRILLRETGVSCGVANSRRLRPQPARAIRARLSSRVAGAAGRRPPTPQSRDVQPLAPNARSFTITKPRALRGNGASCGEANSRQQARPS